MTIDIHGFNSLNVIQLRAKAIYRFRLTEFLKLSDSVPFSKLSITDSTLTLSFVQTRPKGVLNWNYLLTNDINAKIHDGYI